MYGSPCRSADCRRTPLAWRQTPLPSPWSPFIHFLLPHCILQSFGCWRFRASIPPPSSRAFARNVTRGERESAPCPFKSLRSPSHVGDQLTVTLPGKKIPVPETWGAAAGGERLCPCRLAASSVWLREGAWRRWQREQLRRAEAARGTSPLILRASSQRGRA